MRCVCFGKLHAASKYKVQRLRSVHSLRVTEIIEHEWACILREDPRVVSFLRGWVAPDPLDLRSALYVGRTCAFRFRYSALPGESVHYVDFTSLYPYINCYSQYTLKSYAATSKSPLNISA